MGGDNRKWRENRFTGFRCASLAAFLPSTSPPEFFILALSNSPQLPLLYTFSQLSVFSPSLKLQLPQLQIQFLLKAKEKNTLCVTTVHDRMKKTETGARLISVFFLLVHSLSHSTGGRLAAGREPYHVICATFSSPIPAAATCCARAIRK